MPKRPFSFRQPPRKGGGDLIFQIVIGAIVIMAAIICGSLIASLIYQ